MGQCQIANLDIKLRLEKKGRSHIYETYNFSLSNTHQGLQQIQEISFKMKQEPSKITMKEVHNS